MGTMIDTLLSTIPDKFLRRDGTGNLQTTSHKFKRDLWNGWINYPIRKELICAEFGTHRGETTRILSHLFKEVHTVNINDSKDAKELNKDRDNIIYHQHDLHQGWYPFEYADVILIDGDHDEQWVYHDIVTSLKHLKFSTSPYRSDLPPGKTYIFDDWGINTAPGVRRAVQRAIDEGLIEIVDYIGHPKNTIFYYQPNDNIRVLSDWEGIICRECV